MGPTRVSWVAEVEYEIYKVYYYRFNISFKIRHFRKPAFVPVLKADILGLYDLNLEEINFKQPILPR